MWDIFPACEEKDEDALDLEAWRAWRARGEGEFLAGTLGEFLTGVAAVFVLSCAERVRAALRVDDLGVCGVTELDKEEAEEGGRCWEVVEDAVVVFINFVGRVGEAFL